MVGKDAENEKNAKLSDISKLEEKLFFFQEINHPKSHILIKCGGSLINSLNPYVTNN